MENEKALLVGILTKVYNKTEDEITKLIYAEDGTISSTAFDNVTGLDSARVKRFNEEAQARFKNGYAKAKEESGKEFEAKFKAVTGFDADAEDFETLVTQYNTSVQEQLKKKNNEPVKWEQIKTMPDFLKWESERVPKTEYEKVKGEYDQFKSKIERDTKLGSIKSKAKAQLDALNPAYPENQSVKENIVNVFLSMMDTYDYEDDGSGNPIVIKSDGERLQDPHGNPVRLDTFVKQQSANYFEFNKQTPKGNAGNQQTSPGNPTGGDIVFNSRDEYEQLMARHSSGSKEDTEMRIKLLDRFKEKVKDGSLK